ncbi:MAG: alpha/beta hydrolase fold domain-containing protein [Leptolyngbyaceae cyanobacterium]
MTINIIGAVVVGLSILGLGLSVGIIVPAPTLSLFPLTVAAPEISPLLGLSQGAIALITLILPKTPILSGNDYRWFVVGCSLGGLWLSSLPLWPLAATIRQAQTQMETRLGQAYGDRILSALQQQMRPQPFVLQDLVWGIPLSPQKVERDRHQIPTPDGATLTLDLYRPTVKLAEGDSLPMIVVIYGGAWQAGQPEDNAVFCNYMAAQGYGVAAIAYRHAPDYCFPVQLKDVQTSLQWLVHHAPDYQLDPQRLALVGWSAGAHLALLAGYQPDALPIRAVVNYYGPVNLALAYRDLPKPDPIDTRSVLETFLGGPPDDYPDRYQAASPSHWIRSGLPPTLSVYGDRDHLVKPIFGQQLDQALRTAGNQSILIRLPWAEHAFDRVWQGMGNQIALYCVERFLAYTLFVPDD